MKNSLYITALFVFSGLVLSSCDDFLNKQPTSEAQASGAIGTVGNAKVAMAGLMRSMTSSSYYGRNFVMYADAKGGDMTIPSQGFGLDDLFLFSHTATTSSYSSYWSTGYFCILQTNNILENIERLEAAGETGFSFIKGQILTLRALIYFDLVRLYGPPYNYQKTAFGVPLVLETLSFDAQPTRATVEQNYAQILKDLQDGQALLESDKTGEEDGYVGYYANLALQARVKLYMDDYDGALAAAEEIINDGPYKLYSPDEWVDSWKSQYGSESIFELAIYPNEADLGTYSIAYYLMRADQKDDAYGNYVASDIFLDLLGEDLTDVRWGVMDRDHTSTTRLGSCYKYAGSIALEGDGKETFTAVNIKVIRLSEVYFIAAEAALNKATPDKQAAADYLNEIRKRSPALYAAAPATAANITDDMILAERSKELFHEGHRFFDMIRKNRTITFHDGFYNATLPVDRANTIDRTFYKIILPISQAEMNANPALRDQQNPGY